MAGTSPAMTSDKYRSQFHTLLFGTNFGMTLPRRQLPYRFRAGLAVQASISAVAAASADCAGPDADCWPVT